MRVRVQSGPFDPGEELAGFGAGEDVGAVVSFTGVAFHNSGIVDVQEGTLDLAGGGSGSGSYDAALGATILL